ncbi:hypothetical protein B6K86_02525 [Lachnospiraceae bacterium]|nr:hypothetical protein B6K86_02525 [Lachnospiraceae bacterium]
MHSYFTFYIRKYHLFLASGQKPTFICLLLYIFKLSIIIVVIKSGKVGRKPENPHKYWVFTGQIRFFESGQNRANGQKFDQNSCIFSKSTPIFQFWSKISGLWSNPKTKKWAEK